MKKIIFMKKKEIDENMNIFSTIFIIIVGIGIILGFVGFAYKDIKTILSAAFILIVICAVAYGSHYLKDSRDLEMINVEVNDTFDY